MNDYEAIQLAMPLGGYITKWLCIFTEGSKNKAYTWLGRYVATWLWGYAVT